MLTAEQGDSHSLRDLQIAEGFKPRAQSLEGEDETGGQCHKKKTIPLQKAISPSLELVCSSVELSLITQDRQAPISTDLNL